ncbi:response regulator [Paenibacillus roseipurpureus]|uniref:Response regulator n=1 Tax=Paenibacillus roseopurpureus TaxID=2918901 RepID=A0AA96RIK0_9BACL|nr:response regulator [Paenibacillus sp. MBLB1832]WNR42334.1 response regulator [Paenibacillus sp. MBLB1832]
MIRVLIVDDEPIERMALQKIIEEGFTEVEVVGQASNGREAIEAAARLQPDLITMDIKMPGINGLQAIEQIKATNERIKFIMVTAFDTFEFAQQAIRLGVYDYMLKPSRISVVLDTISRVVEEMKHLQLEEAHRNHEKEKLRKMTPLLEADLVEQLLFTEMPAQILHEMIDLIGLPPAGDGFVMTLVFSEFGEQEEEQPDLDAVYAHVKNQLQMYAQPYWIGKMSGHQIPLIVFLDGELTPRAQAIGLARRLLQSMNGIWDRHRLFIGIGGVCRDMRDMRKSYHEALLASMDVSLPARYCLYEDVSRQDIQSVGGHTLEMEKGVLEAARCGNMDGASDILMKMIDVSEGFGQGIAMAQQRIFEVLIIVSRMLEDMGMVVNKPYFPYPPTSYKQLKAESHLLIHQLVDMGDAVETDLLQTMKAYIQAHAHEDLSLERLAATVNRNPFYVSKLFKEHFGMNYIDFLTEHRIETAKGLMQETEMSLKEITYEVGYNDPNYFSRVFKKLVGLSPTDYRKMLLRPSNKKQL